MQLIADKKRISFSKRIPAHSLSSYKIDTSQKERQWLSTFSAPRSDLLPMVEGQILTEFNQVFGDIVSLCLIEFRVFAFVKKSIKKSRLVSYCSLLDKKLIGYVIIKYIFGLLVIVVLWVIDSMLSIFWSVESICINFSIESFRIALRKHYVTLSLVEIKLLYCRFFYGSFAFSCFWNAFRYKLNINMRK